MVYVSAYGVYVVRGYLEISKRCFLVASSVKRLCGTKSFRECLCSGGSLLGNKDGGREAISQSWRLFKAQEGMDRPRLAKECGGDNGGC